MTYPLITRELDRAGVGVMPFWVLAHVARCADRSGAACVAFRHGGNVRYARMQNLTRPRSRLCCDC